MIVTKRETKKTITITSDKFDLSKQLQYESNRAQAICNPFYRAFSSDDPAKRRFGSKASEIEHGKTIASREAVAYLVTAIRLWREGCWEINDFMEKYHGTKPCKAIVPGETVEGSEKTTGSD